MRGRLGWPVVAIGVAVVVLLGTALAFTVWYVRVGGGVATRPSESARPSPSATATASASPEPSPRPTVASPSATAPASGDPDVAELVFRITPWSDIIAPLTTSLAADGRLTTTRVGASQPGMLHLEQRRMTELGIGLLRDEILATGLFDETATYAPIPLPGHEMPGRGTNGYTVEFVNGGRDVLVVWPSVAFDEPEWAEPSPERERLDELGGRLTTFYEWLPPEAWVDPSPRPYAPDRYRFFSVSQPWGGAVSDLPTEVSEVRWPLTGSLLDFGEEQANSTPDYSTRCAVLSAADAQRVVDALAAADAPFSMPLGERYATGAELGDRSATHVVHVTLVALHPHETTCKDAYPPSFLG